MARLPDIRDNDAFAMVRPDMIELLTNTEMAQADRLAISGGVAGIALMEKAGAAVAEAVAARRAAGSRVAVVAGPGNNGGDGFVAATASGRARLRNWSVLLVGEADRLKGDAALAARHGPGRSRRPNPAGLADADIVVDALFGAGLDRPVEGLARAMIEAMNAQQRADDRRRPAERHQWHSGAVMGVAVRAAHTVTFFRKKPGHLLLPGPAALRHGVRCRYRHSGARFWPTIAPQTFENVPALWRAQVSGAPAIAGHKYDRGHAVVVSGPSWSTGAARLSRPAARCVPGQGW